MDLPRILIIGKIGQVGWELRRALAPVASVVAVDYPDIDLANPESIRRQIEETRAFRRHQCRSLYRRGQGRNGGRTRNADQRHRARNHRRGMPARSRAHGALLNRLHF